jgi:amino acid adenylation domain-containing protein
MSTFLTESQQHQILVEWNTTKADFPRDKCLHHLFEAQVERTPEAVAVVFENTRLTYRELNQRANQLAHYLKKLGIGPEVLVGIYIERSLEMVVGLLGILKAGGAYLPLDPAYPQERLAFMLEEAETPVLLSQEQNVHGLPLIKKRILGILTDWTILSNESEENPSSAVKPDNLAYLIYTSGSTGKPKGVMNTHLGICNRLLWMQQAYQLTADDRVLQKTPFSFDVSVWEFFWPLLAGARLVVAKPEGHRDSAYLVKLIAEQQITTLHFVPSMLQVFVKEPAIENCRSVRQVFCSGEALPFELVKRFFARHQTAQLHNLYGPTEAAVDVTFWQCHREQTHQKTVPIGRPIANTQIYLLDKHQEPVAVGEAGELYIGGLGLARGYLNRPELTQEQFRPNPFGDELGTRLYKTGDLARYLPDGNIEYLGRLDYQVKIRGFRIELGEIEALLHQDASVQEAVVVAREDEPDNKRLVAYIVSKLIPERLPIQAVCLVQLDNKPPIPLKTEDISCDGICLVGAPSTWEMGQRLRLRLQVPEIAEELRLYGRVAWCQKQRAGIQLAFTSSGRAPLCQTIEKLFNTQGFIRVIQRTSVTHLRDFLKAKLPEYMIPSSFVFLSAMPLTPNGKIDRQALPKPEHTRPEFLEEFEAPHTPTEALLAGIWAEVLKLEQVGIHDDFIELGGHSLLATQIIARLREVFKIDLPLQSVFELPSVAKLAERVEALRQETPRSAVSPLRPMTREKAIELSFPQQQLWLLTQIASNMPIYNEPFTIRLGGPIDVVALEQSFNEILRRHDALRTTFTTIDGQPVQMICPYVAFNLPVVDLDALPENERQSEAFRQATANAKQAFDLTRYPLFNALLMPLSETDYRLFATFHHIIIDGVSLYQILLPELEALYQAFSSGKPSPLFPPPLQYPDFALWQRQWLQADVLEEQLAYWKQQLADVSPLQLPTDRPPPALPSFRGARQCFILSKDLLEPLKALSRREGVTLFVTLLAAFKALLHRYSGQHDIAVGSVTAGRNHSELQHMMGSFVNTLLLRTDFSGNPSFRQLLQQVREVTVGAYSHQDFPFEQLVNDLQPVRHAGYNPLFQVGFTIEPLMPILESGWTINQMDIHQGTTKFDSLYLALDEKPEGMTGRLEYNTDLFEEATIARMIVHYRLLLENIVTKPQQCLSELSLLTLQEQQQLFEWNNTQTCFPQEACIHQLFESQVERTPEAVAVVFEREQLSYRELNCRANQLAHHLITLGVKPETLVGICVERSIEMIVGLLGILKAGGAYVPLDPAYPQARLAFMLEDAQVSVLLTQQPWLDILTEPRPASIVCLDTDWQAICQQSEENPQSLASVNNLAYVIYTSGSTGRPKGVLIEHRGLCNLALAQSRCFGVNNDSRVLQFFSLNFDGSIWEIVMALASGAALYLGKREALLPGPPLLEQLREQAITTVTLPPSVLASLTVETLPSLQTIIVAGEACSAELVTRWRSGRRFFNAYGPTETTVCATIFECTEDGSQKSPPIGIPIANLQVYVLDAQLQLVPIGVPGELYVGGRGLARGYLNRPALTAEKFIPNPFGGGTPKTRLYKTGDLVRYLPDGNLEFLGRIDHQVKIRGFRIELGEIEALLSQHPTVQETVVIVREDRPGDKRLVAYIVQAEAVYQAEEVLSLLRHFLTEKLPDYMVPSALVLLEALPLTPNGKLDHKALPKPEGLRADLETSYIAPQTEIEHKIVLIWQNVLHRKKVGTHDNFFDLGGNSLLFVQVQEQLVSVLNQDISVITLFQYPTISALVHYLEHHEPISFQASQERAHKKKQARHRHKKRHKKLISDQ